MHGEYKEWNESGLYKHLNYKLNEPHIDYNKPRFTEI